MPAKMVILETPQTCQGCGKVILAGEEAREYPGERYYHKVEPKKAAAPATPAAKAAAALGPPIPLTPAESQQLLLLLGRYLRYILAGGDR